MHGASEAVLRFFDYSHLNESSARTVAVAFYSFANNLAYLLPEDPETTVALRKLLESKDAAVRAALVGDGVIGGEYTS